MMRTDLGRHTHAPCLGLTHQLDRSGRRDMRHVHVPARVFGQNQITCHHDLFGHRRDARHAQPRRHHALVHVAVRVEREVLHVVDDGSIEHRGVLERPPHQATVLHRRSVVAEGHRSALDQIGHFGQFLPLSVLRHAGDRMDVDRRAPTAFDHEFHHVARMNGRVGIGHAGHGREASKSGRPTAGLDRLLVLLARLAQMYVHVHPAGRNELARGIVDRHVVGFDRLGDTDNPAATDQQIGPALPSGFRIEQDPSPNEQIRRLARTRFHRVRLFLVVTKRPVPKIARARPLSAPPPGFPSENS